MLQLELKDGQHVYLPGALLSGRITWEMEQAPGAIAATLSWSTEGKGDEDSDTVIEQHWDPSSETGSIDFQWQLPRGPLSFDGTLIRIGWTLECSSESPDEVVETPIVVSHLKKPIRANST